MSEEKETPVNEVKVEYHRTLEELRESQTRKRKTSHFEPTEAGKEYLNRVRATATQATDLSVEAIMAGFAKTQRHDVDVVAYPLPFDTCYAVFMGIYKHLLSQHGRQLIIDPENKGKHEKLVQYFCGQPVKGLDLRKGICLTGGVGRGKTLVMRSLLLMCNALEERLKNNGKAFTSRAFKEVHVKAIIDEVAQQRSNAPIKRYTKGPWYFDDFGMEDSYKLYGNHIDVMGDIITERYNHYQRAGVLTHVTTNTVPIEWPAKYGDRIDSRLNEMFNIITWAGEDKRKLCV